MPASTMTAIALTRTELDLCAAAGLWRDVSHYYDGTQLHVPADTAAAVLAHLNRPETAAAISDTLKAQLVARAEARWARVVEDGHVTVGGLTALTGERWQGYLDRAIRLKETDGAAVVKWNGTTPVTLAELNALGLAVGTFVQSAWATFGALKTAIAAGTVTTTAQVDDPPLAGLPGWPPST